MDVAAESPVEQTALELNVARNCPRQSVDLRREASNIPYIGTIALGIVLAGKVRYLGSPW